MTSACENQLVEVVRKRQTQTKESTVLHAVRRTKQFVEEHPTVTACAVTALVTAKLVHDKDVDALKRATDLLLRKEEERFALLQDTTSFIDARGLSQDFFDWAPRMRRE
jgi:Zn-finger domain-containing protein